MNTKANTFFLIILLVLFVNPAACSELPDTYSAEAIESWVIDADTKKPIEGVIVVAHWQLLAGMEGSTPVGQMEILETVTDKNGKFTFPAWGPKPRKKGYLRGEDPQILLFKPGYEHRMLHNTVRSKVNYSPVRRSEWNGRRVELKPFKGTMEQSVERFNSLNRELDMLVSQLPEECYWKKIPRMVVAMKQQREKLEKEGARYPYSIDQRLSSSDQYFRERGGVDCGSPLEFIKGLGL